MFEEATVQAGQALLTLFWILLAFILLAAVATTRYDKGLKK